MIINFTSPQASLESLEFAEEAGLAVVIGTTGLSPEQIERVKELSKSVRCVFSPNMSVGVNVMFRIVQEVARVLGPDYDIEILEAHHRLKKDSPSGTAVKLGELIAKAVGRDFGKVGVYGRKGMVGERTKDEIGMQVIRAGDIVGEHTVLFGGIGERLEIIHRAHSRDNFARGAVRAALWVVNQPERPLRYAGCAGTQRKGKIVHTDHDVNLALSRNLIREQSTRPVRFFEVVYRLEKNSSCLFLFTAFPVKIARF